ncbi:hypothetical protein SERLA73DRAFT_65981, partial [Serpula lacrymans var. lacrymans S7.3]
QKPDSSFRYLVGVLQSHGLHIQHRQIWHSLHCVDGLGHQLQKRQIIQHQKYRVLHPNALWHINEHHKLIRWGYIIHGMVDGFCRTVSCHIYFQSSI